ncbi:hypothetical protein HBZS_118260 [Helicobacter bizzozeronii CCUG 35545]|nr:hypothetical protein HBZS_118260 [Helicobacter bizzozeronii CCUG 35545]
MGWAILKILFCKVALYDPFTGLESLCLVLDFSRVVRMG